MPWSAFDNLMATEDGRIFQLRPFRELKQTPNSNGYLRVEYRYRGKRHRALVHRIVARAFHWAHRSDQTQVNHIDADRRNNAASNLEWVSPKENGAHRVAMGNQVCGESHPQAKLTREKVLQARELYAGGLSCAAVARRIGVSVRQAKRVVHGLAWAHVEAA